MVLPDEPVATRDTSDFIAQVRLSAYKNWNVEAGLQWNPEDTRSERSQFRLQYRLDGQRVLNLAYRAQRDVLEQTEMLGRLAASAKTGMPTPGMSTACATAS